MFLLVRDIKNFSCDHYNSCNIEAYILTGKGYSMIMQCYSVSFGTSLWLIHRLIINFKLFISNFLNQKQETIFCLLVSR